MLTGVALTHGQCHMEPVRGLPEPAAFLPPAVFLHPEAFLHLEAFLHPARHQPCRRRPLRAGAEGNLAGLSVAGAGYVQAVSREHMNFRR